MPAAIGRTPPDGLPQQQPNSLVELLNEIIARRGYRNLTELSRHTTVPYKTLWAWSKGSRNTKRPPSVIVLRKFAEDMSLPESVVFRAAGRTYTDPGALDEESLELVDRFKTLPPDDQARLMRIVALFRAMTPAQRVIAEGVVRGITSTDGTS
jgi:hypothetical protein